MSQTALLLATYNGSFFLKSFLDSVFSQTLRPEIFVRDDGSDDTTVDLLLPRADQLTLVNDHLGNVGIVENFNILANVANTDYLAFADQDDIWEPDKLAVQMELMRQMERKFGADMPLLVHSDLAVCDEHRCVIDSSLWRFQRLDPRVRSFARLLVQNNVTGCTVLINKPLKDLAFPVPEGAIMHDWWLAIVAAAFGRIGYVSRPLVRYRQHQGNELGAVRSDLYGAMKRFKKTDQQRSLRAAQHQAQLFCDRFSGRCDMTDELHLAEKYATIQTKCYAQRLQTICKYGFWKQDFIRNVGFIISI
jgi:glycosyltransferase involved in cell wall biosynthesis